jgi:hypothetical protein
MLTGSAAGAAEDKRGIRGSRGETSRAPLSAQAMLKDGHKHFSGLQEAVMKNIEACKGLAQITRTSLGPNGGPGSGWGGAGNCCLTKTWTARAEPQFGSLPHAYMILVGFWSRGWLPG